jgi:PIN domain nuclease of toxin-antitoxin system
MRRLLLDTGTLIWALTEPGKLPRDVADVIADKSNEVLFSAASIWEIAIKRARGEPDLMVEPADILSSSVAIGFIERPVTARVAATISELPFIHKDPFDRLLLAQAVFEPAILLTPDRTLGLYSNLVRVFDPK